MLGLVQKTVSYQQQYAEAANRIFQQTSATSPRPAISSTMIKKVAGRAKVVFPKPTKA